MGELSKQLAQRALDRLDGRITALQEAGIAVGLLAAQLQHAQQLFRQDRTFETHAMCQELLNVAADLAVGKEDEATLPQRVAAIVEQFVAPSAQESADVAEAPEAPEASDSQDTDEPQPLDATPEMIAEHDLMHEEPESALFQLQADDEEDLPSTAQFFPAPAKRHSTTPGRQVSAHEDKPSAADDVEQSMPESHEQTPASADVSASEVPSSALSSQLREGLEDITRSLQRIPDAETIAQATSAALGAQWQEAVGNLLQVVQEMGAQAAEDRALLRESMQHFGQEIEGLRQDSGPAAQPDEQPVYFDAMSDADGIQADVGVVHLDAAGDDELPHGGGDETQEDAAVHADGHDTEASLAAIAEEAEDIAVEHLDEASETLADDAEEAAVESYPVENLDRDAVMDVWDEKDIAAASGSQESESGQAVEDSPGDNDQASVEQAMHQDVEPGTEAPADDTAGDDAVSSGKVSANDKPADHVAEHDLVAEDASSDDAHATDMSQEGPDWDEEAETMVDANSIDNDQDVADTVPEAIPDAAAAEALNAGHEEIDHQEPEAAAEHASCAGASDDSPVQHDADDEDPFADTDEADAPHASSAAQDSVALDVDSREVAEMSMTQFARALQQSENQESAAASSPAGPGISDTAIGRILDGTEDAVAPEAEDALSADEDPDTDRTLRASTDSQPAGHALQQGSSAAAPAVAGGESPRVLKEQVRGVVMECINEVFDDPQVQQKLFAVLALEAATNPSALGELTGIRHFLAQELQRVAAEQRESSPSL